MKRWDFAVLPFVMDLAVAAAQFMVNLRALDLGASATLVGVLLGLCWGVPYAVTSLGTGRNIERYGARALMLAGSTMFGLSTFAYGLAHAPWVLLVAAPLGGAGSALFWPALQTCMQSDTPEETRARTTVFNVSWTIGVFAGGALAGHIYRFAGPHGSFTAISVLVAVETSLIAWRARSAPAPPAPSQPASVTPAARSVVPYLHMAWAANFALWFAGSAAGAIFPRLARGLSFTDGRIGEIAAVVWVGQAIMFAALARGAWWQFRRAPLVGSLLLGLGALMLFVSGAAPAAFAIAYLLLGASRSPAHTASVHYGLLDADRRAANMGFHEAIIGTAFVLGPLVAGVAADIAGVRAPFVVAAVVVVAALIPIRLARGLACAAATDQAGGDT